MIYEYFFQQRFSKIRLYEIAARKILNVEEDDPEWIVKNNYLKLAKKYHPDINKGSEDLFKDINTAYSILTKKDFDIEGVKFLTISSQELSQIEQESSVRKPKEKNYYDFWKNRFF